MGTTNIYTEVGTSGEWTVPDDYTVIPEMTKTLNDLSAGDMLIVTFDATAWIITPEIILLKIMVNGAQLGSDIRVSSGFGVQPCYRIISMTRAYTIPSDGNYTVQVQADGYGTPEFTANIRTLTIQHVDSGTVYDEVGTSGTWVVPTIYTTVPEMTKTLTGLSAGDIVIIAFDATASAFSAAMVVFRVDANGSMIGKRVRIQNPFGSQASWYVASILRIYEVPADGDYTFDIKADGSQNPEFYLNYRTMTIRHLTP